MAEKIAQWNRHGRPVRSVPVHAQVQRAQHARVAGMKRQPNAPDRAAALRVEQDLRFSGVNRLRCAAFPPGIGLPALAGRGGGIFESSPSDQAAGASAIKRRRFFDAHIPNRGRRSYAGRGQECDDERQ